MKSDQSRFIADRVVCSLTLWRDRLRTVGIAAAVVVFAVGLYLSARALPDLPAQLRLLPFLLLILIGAPISAALSAVEMHAVSRIAGGPMTWRTCVEVTIYTSAANMLPLPGGAIAKLAAMKSHGVSYRTGSAMIVLSYAIWGALAFAYSSIALALIGKGWPAILFAACGVALMAVSWAGYSRFGQWRLVGILALTRLVSFPFESIRYLLALLTVGASVTLLQSSVYVVASFMGSAIVFAPSGLGVTEGAAAMLSTIVGVSAATGFLAATIGRLARLVGLSLLAGGLLLRRRPPRSTAENYSGSA